MAKRANKVQHTKKSLLQALEKTLGVVTTACKLVGVDRSTYYKYYNEDPEFRAAADDMENVALDFSESQLHQQIKNGSTAATIFHLKTKGRKRGWQENMDLTTDGERIDNTIKVVFEDFSKGEE